MALVDWYVNYSRRELRAGWNYALPAQACAADESCVVRKEWLLHQGKEQRQRVEADLRLASANGNVASIPSRKRSPVIQSCCLAATQQAAE